MGKKDKDKKMKQFNENEQGNLPTYVYAWLDLDGNPQLGLLPPDGAQCGQYILNNIGIADVRTKVEIIQEDVS